MPIPRFSIQKFFEVFLPKPNNFAVKVLVKPVIALNCSAMASVFMLATSLLVLVEFELLKVLVDAFALTLQAAGKLVGAAVVA